ncbi:MAG: hypothetical protein P4N59_09945, partial [Negativicutes bacterium]|nr:hypothetical protein [Negativicutes bacterium]
TNGNLVFQGATVGNVSIQGFRDLTIEPTIISSGTVNIGATRNLTVGNVTSGSTGYLYLVAAGESSNNVGELTLNGTLSVGDSSTGLNLTSGTDGSGNRLSENFTSSNLIFQSGTVGEVQIEGFHNLSIAHDIISSGVIVLDNDALSVQSLTSGSGAYIDLNGSAITVLGSTGTTRTWNANTATIYADHSIYAGAANLSLITDNFSEITNTISGTGTLSFAPYTVGKTIGIGTNAACGGSCDISFNDTELGYIQPGFANVTFGSASAGTIDINTGSAIANQNLTFISGGSITLDASGDSSPQALTKNGGGNTTLTMEAGTDIVLNNAITASGTGAMNVVLDSDTASGGGVIVLNSNITSNGGNITLGGQESNPANIVAGTGYAVGDALQASGIYINGIMVDAGGGSIIMNGRPESSSGYFGLWLTGTNGTIQTSGSGNITLTGNGTAGGASSWDIILGYGGSGDSVKTTGSGAITLTGICTTCQGLYANNVFGGASDTGNITVDANIIGSWSATAQTTGNVTFTPHTASTSIGF